MCLMHTSRAVWWAGSCPPKDVHVPVLEPMTVSATWQRAAKAAEVHRTVHQAADKRAFFEAVKVVVSCPTSNRKPIQEVSQIRFLFFLMLSQGYVY